MGIASKGLGSEGRPDDKAMTHWLRAEAELICSATVVLSLGAALKIRGSQLQTSG